MRHRRGGALALIVAAMRSHAQPGAKMILAGTPGPKFAGLKVDSMVADPRGFGEDW